MNDKEKLRQLYEDMYAAMVAKETSFPKQATILNIGEKSENPVQAQNIFATGN